MDLVALWEKRINLTGADTAQKRVQVLIQDPLDALSHLGSGPLIDVGSGNGSPGMVLALLRPDLGITLLEPRVRRWAFLQEVTRMVGRRDIRILRNRYQEYEGSEGQAVTVRGLSSIDWHAMIHLVADGGHLLVFGKKPSNVEPFTWKATHSLTRSTLHVLRKCST